MTKKTMTVEEKVAMFRNNAIFKSSSYYQNERQQMVENFLESDYFASSTQMLVFKRMLKEIHESLREEGKPVLAATTYHAYKELIDGIKELFPESWQLVRYFKYYAGTSELNKATQMDVLNAVIAITKRDRSKFDRLEFSTDESE